MGTSRSIALACLLLAAAGAATAQMCCGGEGDKKPAGPAVRAQADAKGTQKATVVVNNAFSPASITVKAGKPVQITFDTKSRGCATSVSFDGLNITKELKDGTKTVVAFTPKKAGSYTFACPMKMIKGTLVVK